MPLRALLKIFGLACVLFCVAFITVAWEVIDFAGLPSESSADVAIVLGAAAWGNKPSPVYRERINEAISLYKRRRIRRIIFTGGTSKEGFPSEAEVGQKFAISNAIPSWAILVDVDSRSTIQNLRCAKDLMDKSGLHTALLVSDPMHMKRAMAMAADLGSHARQAPTSSSRFQSLLTQTQFLSRETWLNMEYMVLRQMLPKFNTDPEIQVFSDQSTQR